MSSDGNQIIAEGEERRKSKLTTILSSQNDGINTDILQISVYYSENNWDTFDEIHLMLDQNTTINELLDSAIYKFKNDLLYNNIDRKHLNVLLFKKKKKVPNDEYPLCNPESKIKDYGKMNFCLVEDKISKNGDDIASGDCDDKITEEQFNVEKEEETNNVNKIDPANCNSCLIL